MNIESMPASTVLYIYNITALKCPWALSNCESKVWYWLAATSLMPGKLKATKKASQSTATVVSPKSFHVNQQKLQMQTLWQ